MIKSASIMTIPEDDYIRIHQYRDEQYHDSLNSRLYFLEYFDLKEPYSDDLKMRIEHAKNEAEMDANKAVLDIFLNPNYLEIPKVFRGFRSRIDYYWNTLAKKRYLVTELNIPVEEVKDFIESRSR